MIQPGGGRMHVVRHIIPNMASGAAVTSPVLVAGMPITVFMPYVMQLITLVGALAYAFYRDGAVGDQFVWGLLGAVGLNIVAGAAATISSHNSAATAIANGMVVDDTQATEPTSGGTPRL